MQLLVFSCRWSSYGWRLRGRRLDVDFLSRDFGEAGREDWINEGRTVSVNVQSDRVRRVRRHTPPPSEPDLR
jgi:hypothetical protein